MAYLDNYAIKQVLQLRWLQSTQLSFKNIQQCNYERFEISQELVQRIGIERTAEIFDRLFNTTGLNLSIDVKL